MAKKILVLLIALATLFTSFNALPVQADEAVKPAAPKFKLKISEDESLITITISKNADADGYRIYAKEPGSGKIRSVALIKKNGKKTRTFTYSPFYPGKYTFSVKAYHKEGKTKVWSDASVRKNITVKSDVLSRVPVGIRFAEGTLTDFTMGIGIPGGCDRDKYQFEYECDEEFENAVVRLLIVDPDGTRAVSSPFNYDETERAVGAIELGECYAILYAFEKEADVELRNPLARSEMIKLRSMDEKGNTAPKYADITFKNGYAYFGTGPTKLITDKVLKAKILAAEKDHEFYLYDGDEYMYDDHFDIGPFKYVPVEWRILEQTDDYVLLMNNSIIEGGGYDGYRETKTTTWKTSSLYYMLNEPNNYKKEERTFWPKTKIVERVLIEMDICGTKAKFGIPTLEMLTNKDYGFSTSKDADKNRVVEPSKIYDLGTNHKATRHGVTLYGMYWVANEKPGETILVDQNGKIRIGEFDCNVYEFGVVNVIKVNLKFCNVFYK